MGGYRIAHLPKAGGCYHVFKNPWFTESYPADLALNYIDPEIWSQGDRLGLPPSRIAKAHDVAAHDLLMLCGYPGETSYFSRFTGDPVLHSPAIPYTAREIALPTGFNAGIHFALKYEMELSESADGSKEKLPKPGGYSGSPILDSGFVACNCSRDWAPAQARIIGIATRWIEEESCGIATKSWKVREFLLANVRNASYHHWVERGKPADAQVDFDYAAQQVPDVS